MGSAAAKTLAANDITDTRRQRRTFHSVQCEKGAKRSPWFYGRANDLDLNEEASVGTHVAF